MTVPEAIRDLRQNLGIPQTALARQLGLSSKTLSDIATGKWKSQRTMLLLRTFARRHHRADLAKVFGQAANHDIDSENTGIGEMVAQELIELAERVRRL